MKIGDTKSFFSDAAKKEIKGTVMKVNNKTVILEVEKQTTTFEKIKGFLGKIKLKKHTVTEMKHVKKRFNQLTA